MNSDATRSHIDKEPINHWARKRGVTETTGHDQLVGQTLRIHGKGAFEVGRIADGQIHLIGKHRPIPISVLSDENAVYIARRAGGTEFEAKVTVVTGDTGACSQAELHRERQPRRSIASSHRMQQLAEANALLCETDVEEMHDMFLTWNPDGLGRIDPLNIVFGFEMAKLAYIEPIGKVQKMLEQPGLGFKEVRAFNNPKADTQAFLAVTPDEKGIVIAFRGTTPGKDIVTDLSVSFTDFVLGGLAHEGFQNYVRAVKALLYEHLDKVMKLYPEAKVFGAGHSLGAAAINNFIGTALGEGVIQPAQVGRVVLAGCPRGFNWKASRLIRELIPGKVDRCVNAADVVAKVPALLSSALASVLHLFHSGHLHPGLYKHVVTFSSNVFFDKAGRETASKSWVYRLWASVNSIKGQATDHFINNYLQRGYDWAREQGRLPAQTVSQRLATGRTSIEQRAIVGDGTR